MQNFLVGPRRFFRPARVEKLERVLRRFLRCALPAQRAREREQTEQHEFFHRGKRRRKIQTARGVFHINIPTKNSIAVSFALPQESALFRKQLTERRVEERGSLPVISGRLAGRNVLVFHTGIGASRAYQKTVTVLATAAPSLLISSGFAGGLDPALRAGDLVVANNVSDAYLLARLQSSIDRFQIGRLFTAREVIESPAAKSALRTATDAIAVDMETEGIARACAGSATAFLSIRAISDGSADALPVPTNCWFDATRQQPRVLSLLAFLAAHPGKIPAFARFVGNVRKAQRALARGLPRLIAALD